MLQVVNRASVGSLGVDSLVGSAPPPGYTSQRDTASPIAVINDDDEQEKNSSSPQPPPSMEYRNPLPSPYSIENLRVRTHEQDQNPKHSLHYGYTQTHHSQSTPARSCYYPPQQQQHDDARPLSWETLHFYSPPQILSTDNLFGATTNEQSRPYHYRCSTEEHWQPPPVQVVDNQHHHQQQPTSSPYTDYSLPTSPYHHRRHPPLPLRVLSYPSTDEGHYGCKEFGNEEEGDGIPNQLNDQRRRMMLDSTATILSPSEEPSGFHQSTHDLTPPPSRRRRRLPSPPNSPTRQTTIATDPTKSATKKKSLKKKKSPTTTTKPSVKPHSTPPPQALPPPTQTQPTNYVYISRKCNPPNPTPKSRGWRRKTTVVVQPNTQIPPPPPKLSSSSSSSAITGTFTINPELYIPPSLLNALEDPVSFLPSRLNNTNTEQGLGETRRRTSATRRKRRTNLRLEVENGGIDVDIHLVPSTVSNDLGGGGGDAGNPSRGQHWQDASFCDDTHVRAQTSASTSTTAFSGPSSTTTHPRTSMRMQENPSGGTPSSPSRRGISITPNVTRRRRHTVTSSSEPEYKRDKLEKKKQPPPSRQPTTIDLRIKQGCCYYYQQQLEDSLNIGQVVVFPLIARIHAPNPRPPFHLFASTIDIIPTTTTTNSPIQVQTTDSTFPSNHQQPTSPKEPQTRNRHRLRRASTSNRHTNTSIRDSRVFCEPAATPIIDIVNTSPPPPPPLPPIPPIARRRTTRRSLSKYRPQRGSSVASSHGHGHGASVTTPTGGGVPQAPPSSSLSQLNLTSPKPSSSSPSPSSSPLYLHLPRTFRGPLTIHISSGHISDRLRLSEGMEREVALIRESEFSRGYFVGGLGWDVGGGGDVDVDVDVDVGYGKRRKRDRVRDDDDYGGDEGEMGEGEGGNDVDLGTSGGGDQIGKMKKKKKRLGKNVVNLVDESELSSSSPGSSPRSSPGGSSSSSSPLSAARKGAVGQGEWYGDRIEILVGSGDVYLQFEDEIGADDDGDDLFCRTTRGLKKESTRGFWKRLFSYPKGFFL